MTGEDRTTPRPHDTGDPKDCRECQAQERLLDADPTEEWVADRWSVSTAHPRAALEGAPHE